MRCSKHSSTTNENSTKMKYKNSNDKSDADEKIKALEKRVETLEGICKAFSFILPTPVLNHKDCVTSTELYRTQHKMARQMWIEYINSKSI